MNKPTSLKIILVASALFYLAFIFRTSFIIKGERYFTLVDDAMISMRYAKHLAQGYGLVWNIGEPSAQGFTNLGWTLYMALLHLFPFSASKISLAVMLTSAIILLANAVVVYKIAETLAPKSNFAPPFAALIAAFYFPLVFWTLRGMEVGLLVLLINLAALYSLRANETKKPLLVGVWLALAIFVRVDALISSAVIVAYLFAKNKRGAILPAIAVVLATLAVFYFQQTYYGDYLPATYHQKMTGYDALERAKRGVLVFVEFASRDTLALLFFSLTGIFFYKQFSRETFLLLGIFLAQCAYSIYVGGDYAEPETNAANRFVTQGMSALIILFSWIASRVASDLETVRGALADSQPKANPIALAALTLLVVSGSPWFFYAADSAPLLKSDIRRVKLALHIAANTSPEAVIAVHAAGQIPYYSERKTIDLLGLNDPVIAKGQGNGAFYPGHNKWNYEYSIAQLRPDLIADNFEPLADYMHGNELYQMLPSDVYVRKDSSLVNVEGISSKEYR